MKVLFIGDIVGRIGRRLIKEKVPYFVEKYGIDFVIANGENATHGKGLIKHHYHELIDSGVDVITLGNHYDNKNEIRHYIDNADRLIRPINLLHEYPGVGTEIYDLDGYTIRVTNVMGGVFMGEAVNSPYLAMLEVLSEEEPANIHIVDFHAEATGEKQCLAYALDGKVSAVIGTHTHVQTNDAKVLPNGTAFISDVGMCGYADGVLGVTKETVIPKILYGENSRFSPPDEGRGLFSAVVIDIDENTGKSRSIFSIYYQEE